MPEIKEHDSSDKDWINEIDLDEFEDDLSDNPDTTIEDDLDD